MQTLGLTGMEDFSVSIPGDLQPKGTAQVTVKAEGQEKWSFECGVRLDTQMECEYYTHGGVLPYVLRQQVKKL